MGYVGFERKYFFFLCGDKNPIYEFGHKTTVYIPYIYTYTENLPLQFVNLTLTEYRVYVKKRLLTQH